MAANIQQIVNEYEERVRRLPNVPALSYGRPMLRDDGAPNRFFLTYLFTENVMFIEFGFGYFFNTSFSTDHF
jgi:hypothetical protein